MALARVSRRYYVVSILYIKEFKKPGSESNRVFLSRSFMNYRIRKCKDCLYYRIEGNTEVCKRLHTHTVNLKDPIQCKKYKFVYRGKSNDV